MKTNLLTQIREMKKLLIITSMVALASACNMNSPEMLEQQIKKKKDQVRELNDQIASLEEQLSQNPGEEAAAFLVPVSIKEMDSQPFEHYIEITGRLEAEEDAFISPEMNGQIDKIYVIEGQSVQKGQLMLSLNTSITESSIQEVKTGLELATKLYEKQKDLWDQKIGSEMQYLEAKNAKEQAEARLATLDAQLDMARVSAPFTGIVETIMLKEGEMAAPGMQVIQMVSLNNLKLYGNISERYITSIKKGDMVIVTFPDVEGLNVTVPIHRIGNVIDNASGTFRIEMKINNRQKTLKPNMYSTIQVNDFSSTSAFVAPSISIKQDIKGNYIYVATREEGVLKARKRYIETGLSYRDQTMIKEGVSQGEEVIVKGFAQVSDGVNIAVK
jgi:membrane fusion protein (multidrug efflux system)